MTDTPATAPDDAPNSPASPSSGLGWFGIALRWGVLLVAGFAVIASFLLFGMVGPPDVLLDEIELGEKAGLTLAAIRIISLNYQYYTDIGIELKAVALTVALGALCVMGGLAVILPRRASPSSVDAGERGPTQSGLEPPPGTKLLAGLGLIDIAQGLLVLLVLWSLMTRAWSHAPDLATRGTVRLAVQAAWAVLLARVVVLSGRPDRTALGIVVALLAGGLAALLLVFRLRGLPFWPRDSFLPLGSSQDFAVCVLPVLLLVPLWAWSLWPYVRGGSSAIGTARWSLCVAGLGVLILAFGLAAWGIVESGSRPAWIGALAGATTLIALMTHGRMRWAAAAIGTLLTVLLISRAAQYSLTSGSLEAADMRQCSYGWRYVLRTVPRTQALGFGQAGFTLLCDPWVVEDLPLEPTALAERWRGHAQSEWFQTLCDLGLLGFHISVGVVVVTVLAGLRALREMSDPRRRWLLIGLLAALIGMSVEECFASGLRREVLPTIWYTVLGLCWAVVLAEKRTTWSPAGQPAPVRFGLAAVLLIVGPLVCVGGWYQLLGEHELALARQRLRSPRPERVAEAVGMTRRAARRTLSPRSQIQARLISARARYSLGVQKVNEVFLRAGKAVSEDMALTATQPATTTQPHTTRPTTTAATRPVMQLWADPDFRTSWEDADEHLEHALRRLADVQRLKPEAVGRATLEAEVSRALSRLWQLRAALTGTPGDAIFTQAIETARRHQLRVQTTLLAAFARQPFDDAVTIALLRSKHDLTMTQVVDLLRRPLRSPYLTEDYRSVLMQASQAEGFAETLNAFQQRARQDVLSESDAAWQDPFSPETLRMIAIIYEMQGGLEQAVAAMNQALRLYEMAHHRLSAEQALAMGDLAWYQFLLDRGQNPTALGIAKRALDVSDRPATHPVLRPIYRRLMPMLLAFDRKQDAANLIPYALPQGKQADSKIALSWSYELLGRTFHAFKPSLRPEKWGYWIQQAVELNPTSPDARVLMALWYGEAGKDDSAADQLRQAWKLSRDDRNREEVLRALVYLGRRTPDSRPLKELHDELRRLLRASTQPTRATHPALSPATQP